LNSLALKIKKCSESVETRLMRDERGRASRGN